MAEDDIPEVEVNVTVEPVGGTKSINFAVYECEGVPVFKVSPEFERMWDLDAIKDEHLVRDRDGLQPGDRILVPMIHGPLAEAVVEQDDNGKLHARSGETHGHTLKYRKQPGAPCWVVVGSYNLRGLKRLNISRGEEPDE